ncbi:hypothetical protein IAT40_005739 [Kwoniella sp. CBS 6097]
MAPRGSRGDRGSRSATGSSAAAPAPAAAAPAEAAVPPTEEVPIPPGLLQDEIFSKLSICEGKPSTLPYSPPVLASLEHFVNNRNDYTPEPAQGVIAEAESLRYQLLSKRYSAAAFAPIMTAIQELSDRVERVSDRVERVETSLQELRHEYAWQRNEDADRRLNKAHTVAGIPWLRVRSHRNGQSAPNDAVPRITKREDVAALEEEHVASYLEHYSLASEGSITSRKERLGSFLSGQGL